MPPEDANVAYLLTSCICHPPTRAHVRSRSDNSPVVNLQQRQIFFPVESISRHGLFSRRGFKEENDLSYATRQFSLNVITSIVIHSMATSWSWNSLFKKMKMLSFTGQKGLGGFLSLVGNIQLENTLQMITMQWHFKLNNCNIFQCCHYSNEIFLLMYLILSKKLKFLTTQKIVCGQP